MSSTFTPPVPSGTGYETQFQTQNIAPPNSIYFTTDDNMFLYVVPSVVCTLRIGLRYLLPTGEIKVAEFDLTTVATRSPQVQIQDIGEGFILGINVFCLTQALRRGQCWVKFVLQRGGINVQQLTQTICQGYVTEYTSLFWPSAQTDYELSGYGNYRAIVGSVPAAGADISETVPTGAVWRLISLKAQLTASATVANRIPQFLIDDGTNVFYQVQAATAIAAGVVALFNWLNIGVRDGALTTSQLIPVPNGLFLPAGSRLRTATIALQAGDQWTAPTYCVEEFLQP